MPVAAFSRIVPVGKVSPVIPAAAASAHGSIPRMSLEAILKTAIVNLRSGSLEREEDVKLAVILPILQALGWNPADPGSLRPEYPASSGRVDYALLCHGRPQVFLEAKRGGALDVRAEAQLFRYAVNNGVPLLVLSDGRHWDFYLSMADGAPEERRFHAPGIARRGEGSGICGDAGDLALPTAGGFGRSAAERGRPPGGRSFAREGRVKRCRKRGTPC